MIGSGSNQRVIQTLPQQPLISYGAVQLNLYRHNQMIENMSAARKAFSAFVCAVLPLLLCAVLLPTLPLMTCSLMM